MRRSARDCWTIFKNEFVITSKEVSEIVVIILATIAALAAGTGIIIGGVAGCTYLFIHLGIWGIGAFLVAVLLSAVTITAAFITMSKCV